MNTHTDPQDSDLPYRPCVGIMLFNSQGKAWIGERLGGLEVRPGVAAWQMPQGGIDPGEAPQDAAYRELFEETSVRTISIAAQSRDWLKYDLPRDLLGRALKGKYKGQKQKWFLARFEGDESEIDVLSPGDGTEKAEFSDWKWVEIDEIVGLIVPFKRNVYESLTTEFGPIIRRITG